MISHPHRKLPLAIFLLLAGVYLLSTGGHTYATDEERLINVAESLLFHGGFALNAGTGEPPRYSTYGPGQSVAAVPLVAVGHGLAALLPDAVAPWAVRLAISWFNPLVTAATGALVALAALRLGYGPRPAAAAALIYGLATIAWPHSKTFFAEPLAAGLTFAAFVVMQSATGNRQHGSALVFGGLLAGLACTVKLQAGLALPFLGMWLLYEGVRQRSATQTARSQRLSASGDRLKRYAPAALAAIGYGFGALAALALLGLYQWALFGSPLRSGYGGGGGVFTNDLLKGLYGLLLSPGKGIIWYAPPLILLPLGLAGLWRRDRGVAALCAAIGAATLLLYARVIFWHGDGAWGPRYLNMALPFMALPLVALIDPRPEPSGPPSPAARPLRAALAVALALAVPVQAAGVLVNLNAYLGVQRDAQRRYFEPAQSPIAGHLRLAGGQLATAYALRLAPGTLALASGLSYSEGDRAAGAQLPRWSLPEARLVVRPPPGAGPLRVDLALSGCLPAPLPPAVVGLALDGRPLGSARACPPRRYALLLPPGRAEIALSASPWRPADAGIDRDGELGVYITSVAARAGGEPLALAGRLVPIPPAPAGPVALRQWSSDYRHGHWDLWPWYLAHAGLPARPAWLLAGLWAGMALALLALGAAGLRVALAGEAQH